LPIRASALAFTTILALVPLLALSLSTFQYVGGVERALETIETLVSQYLVFGTHILLMQKMTALIERLNAQSLGVFGLGFATVTSARLFIQINRAVQRIWGTKGQHRDWLRFIVFFGLMFFAPMILAVSIGWLSSLAMQDAQLFSKLWSSNSFFRLFFLFVPIFYLIKWAPTRRVAWHSALLSSGLTFLALIWAQKAYIWATLNLFNYNELYGSLAAFPLFLIWIYIWWSLMLFGFLFCSTHQKFAEKGSAA